MESNVALGLAQSFYVAYYGRPGDPAGLIFWAKNISENGGVLKIRNDFGSSVEFESRFGSFDNETLVNNLYQQMFARDAEPEGLNFWVGLIEDKEITLSSAAIEILNGASGKDISVFANKLEAANHFTAALDTQAEQQQYQANQAADEAAELLASVTDEPETLIRMKTIVETAYGEPGTGQNPDVTLQEAEAAFAAGNQNSGGDDGSLGGILDGVGNGLEDIVTDTGNTFGDEVGGITGDLGGTVSVNLVGT